MGEVKPDWIKVNLSPTDREGLDVLARILDGRRLHTVCQSARCPNLPQCWGERTATFLLLGDVCTRSCGFCAVATGWPGGALDTGEPQRVAEAARALGLRYVVMTSVDRDDLPDGGTTQFAGAVEAVHRLLPGAGVEVLIPDYETEQLERLLDAGPSVVGHNLETVARLTPQVRDPRASYARSLEVLTEIKRLAPDQVTKSSLLLGMGEELWEVEEALEDLRDAAVDIVMLGQYLRPSPVQIPVARYIPPEEFSSLGERARSMGFRGVIAAPLARTSYRAASMYEELQ
ncbi:MAG: lipoyl synthase [Candidatus Bipolaricaulota bacterium]